MDKLFRRLLQLVDELDDEDLDNVNIESSFDIGSLQGQGRGSRRPMGPAHRHRRSSAPESTPQDDTNPSPTETEIEKINEMLDAARQDGMDKDDVVDELQSDEPVVRKYTDSDCTQIVADRSDALLSVESGEVVVSFEDSEYTETFDIDVKNPVTESTRNPGFTEFRIRERENT